MASNKSQHHHLDRQPDDALFFAQETSEIRLEGMIVTFHENERPLQGLAGLMDWRCQGALSDYLRAGALTGQKGECAYVPVTRNGRTIHLILVGAGESAAPGTRKTPDESILEPLRKNLAALKLEKIGISRSDFGGVNEDFFSQKLKGASLWIVN